MYVRTELYHESINDIDTYKIYPFFDIEEHNKYYNVLKQENYMYLRRS